MAGVLLRQAVTGARKTKDNNTEGAGEALLLKSPAA